MCDITNFLRERRAAMGPNERLTVDAEWIDWALEQYACLQSGSLDHGGSRAEEAALELRRYSTAELAEIRNCSVSKIKEMCKTGVFGDPSTLKPNGRDWEVPHKNLVDLEKQLSAGWQITANGLIAPSREPGRAGENPPAQQETDTKKAPARRPRRRGNGRHGGWRNHVPAQDA